MEKAIQLSQNFQTPQIWQKNSLAKYAKSQYEFNVVDAHDDIPILNLKADALVDTLTKWKFMVGGNLINQSEAEAAFELATLASFVKENYGNFTIKMITNAINLSIKEVLDVDARSFNQFTALYVGRVLNAYLRYDAQVMNSLKERFDNDIPDSLESPKPTPESEMEGFKDIVSSLYRNFSDNGNFIDPFSIVYNFFKKKRAFDLSGSIVEDALKYGQKKYESEFMSNSFSNSMMKVFSQNKESLIKSFAREYVLRKFFTENDLETILSKINIEDFGTNG